MLQIRTEPELTLRSIFVPCGVNAPSFGGTGCARPHSVGRGHAQWVMSHSSVLFRLCGLYQPSLASLLSFVGLCGLRASASCAPHHRCLGSVVVWRGARLRPHVAGCGVPALSWACFARRGFAAPAATLSRSYVCRGRLVRKLGNEKEHENK